MSVIYANDHIIVEESPLQQIWVYERTSGEYPGALLIRPDEKFYQGKPNNEVYQKFEEIKGDILGGFLPRVSRLTGDLARKYIFDHFKNDPTVKVTYERLRGVHKSVLNEADGKFPRQEAVMSLKAKLTKLAWDNKDIRPYLLPILKKAGSVAPRHRDLYLRITSDTLPEESIWGLDIYFSENGYPFVSHAENVRRGPFPLPKWASPNKMLGMDWLEDFLEDNNAPVFGEVGIPGQPYTSDFRVVQRYIKKLRDERWIDEVGDF